MSERAVTEDSAEHLIAAGAAATSQGRKCLNVPAFFTFSQDLTAGQTRLDMSQTVDGDADFWLRGWSYIDTGGGFLMLSRFRLLSGYYLSNALMPLAALPLRAQTPELKIPAGGFIGIEGTNGDAVTRRLKIVFFGVKRFFID